MAVQGSNSERPVVEREIRFAVVMYGGVSLAIYINGVAQELYKMVRATARRQNDDGSPGDYFIETPEGTEAVYRSLGELLRARIVIDILSGTSAGGINAIFLAKALANNQQISQLEKLWIDEGDISLLINDRNSVADIRDLQVKPPPTSLLNSQRMYYRLLEALDGMDRVAPRSQADTSPFVDELDLYVTATDIRGLWLPVPLADEDAHEYRYRTVFRFYHSTLDDQEDWSQDFLKENNPFLAFAARATSSFPFAFEPIKLGDVGTVLNAANFVQNYPYTELRKGWQRFYKDYNRQPDSIDLHSFGDGGYLDNKPFSYITETLLRRQTQRPVDRRLIYIEPAPEHERTSLLPKDDRPDAVENVLAALVSLPRYETIRDDLLQIESRNDLIERTEGILRQIERTRGSVESLRAWQARGSDWAGKYLDQIVPDYGPGYAAYQQLRIADTLDDLAAAMGRNIGLEDGGRPFKALRQILEAWRSRSYATNSNEAGLPENDLLFRLDLGWRLRRLYFLLSLIDDLSLGLRHMGPQSAGAHLTDEDKQERDYASEIISKSGQTWNLSDEAGQAQYAQALSWLKRQLNEAYRGLRVSGRKLRARSLALADDNQVADPALKAYVLALQPLMQMAENLEVVLQDEAKLQAASETIETLSLSLASRPATRDEQSMGYLSQAMRGASQICRTALAITDHSGRMPLAESWPAQVSADVLASVQSCLRFYYEYFEYFDMLTFPISYATPIGESDVVDVYRISSEDATGLFSAKENKRPKLAGTRLGSFGAFFKKEWRQNDLMWGRLDGAERILTTLLPDSPKRTELLLRAWLEILKEKLDPVNLSSLREQLGGAWEEFDNSPQPSAEAMQKMQANLRSFFERNYTLNLDFSPQASLNALGRSIEVLGGWLDGLGEKYKGTETPAFWLSRLGRIFLGVLQVAIPGSLPRLFFQHWVKILYLFELFLITAGAFLGFNNTVMRFGILSLLVTLSIDLAVRLVGSYISGSTRLAGILRGLAMFIVALVLLAIIALIYLGLVHLGVAELPPFRVLRI
jgi:patatin-related protein